MPIKLIYCYIYTINIQAGAISNYIKRSRVINYLPFINFLSIKEGGNRKFKVIIFFKSKISYKYKISNKAKVSNKFRINNIFLSLKQVLGLR